MDSKQPAKISNGIYLAIASLSVGWLIGLSVSPIVNIIVSSVIVILVSAVTLLGGLNLSDEEKTRIPGNIRTLPLAILTLFIGVGASVGIYARTNEWLGNKNTNTTAISTGGEGKEEGKAAGLYAFSVKDCDLLSLQTGEDLRKAFSNLQNPEIDSILKECRSDLCLMHLKNILCTTAKK
jgi:hypothetical protein